jgi:hypothetical protein
MSVLIQIAVGVSLIILSAGVVNWVNIYLGSVKKSAKNSGLDNVAASEERLREIERRLTDVQDVMIALNEKFDRWDEEHHKTL